jgi:hypothetical protein
MIQGHSARRASSRVRQCHQLIKISEIKSEVYTSPAIEPCPQLCAHRSRLTTVDDGRPRSRLLRRLCCTTLMSSTVDNVCIHVHRHLDPRRRRPRRGQPLRPICTPVRNDSPHGHTRRRAEGIIIPDIIPRATMRTSHKSYHPQTHVHHVFFGQTPYRPAEPGVPLPRRASPLVRYCGEALSSPQS